MKVYLHLAEGFEEIEAISVVDILRRAKINVETVSLTGNLEVTGAHEIIVKVDKLFEETDYDCGSMIILPGGLPGTNNINAHNGIKDMIVNYYNQDKWLGAICAAPIVFGGLGLLKNRTATSYPGFEEELSGAKLSVEPVVQDGKIITSRGPGTANLFALKIVEVLAGSKIAAEIKNGMLI